MSTVTYLAEVADLQDETGATVEAIADDFDAETAELARAAGAALPCTDVLLAVMDDGTVTAQCVDAS